MKDYRVSDQELLNYINTARTDLDIAIIQRAIAFASEAHKSQKRKSGEAYISHPLSVCLILAEMKADQSTLIAGLLHDVLEDTEVKYSELAEVFGKEVTELVDGVTKLIKYPYSAEHKRQDDQADNYRKLLLAITKDIRVLLIKLADRLHNMHTLQYQEEASQKRIAKETLDIYAPLANRFGLVKIQNELEDLCLKYLDPIEYKNIACYLNETKAEREDYIKRLLPDLEEIFKDNEIPAEFYGRAKHLYSIYRKNLIRRVPYSEIYDFVGIRVLVDTPDQCYFALALIHSLFEPTERKLKDYINRPKANGYQSLHTVVIGPDKRKVEFQIRTHEMHIFAEEGVAAHWRYKAETYDKQRIFNNTNELKWIKDILNKEVSESEEFIGLLRSRLESPFIIVVSPQNDYIKLSKSSCPLDFAFAIHSEVGLRCIGARINDRLVSLKTILHDGDKVEIITSSQVNPSKDWMNLLKSPHARQKLGNYLRKKEREDAILLGKEIFEKRCRKLHWKYKSEEDLKEILRAIKVNDRSTLYYLLGTGKLLFSQIKENVQSKLSLNEEIQTREIKPLTDQKNLTGIRLGEVSNLMINYAACCHPLTGDDVIGYITRGRGLSIHRADCSNPSFRYQCEAEPERVVSVQWDLNENSNIPKYLSYQINISGKYRSRMIFDIMGVFARYQCQATEIKRFIQGHQIEIGFRILLPHSEDYDKIYKKLINIQGLDKIEKTQV